jgi:hypothetical protein
MVVRLDSLAGLMDPHTSQTRHTRPREVVNSTLMVIPSINLRSTKRAIALVNSSFPPLHLILLLGSSENFFTFSLCNCVFSIDLSGELSPYPFITLPLSLGPHRKFLCIFLGYFTCTSTLSSSPERFPTASPPSSLCLFIFTTMPRERGKSRRGAQYYNALSRHGKLSPSQLALIVARISGPMHNSQGSSVPPLSSPHSIHGNFSVKEEAPPLSKHIPLPTSLLGPPKVLDIWRQ